MNKTSKDLPLKEKAYIYIKEKIVTCELKPGTEILETDFANEMGISRTPVREAILRLSEESFITIYPRKGMVVSPITIQDIHEVFQVRTLIEPYAAINACKNMSTEKLKEYEDYFSAFNAEDEIRPYTDYFKKDFEFHKYIISSLRNEKIVKFMDQIYDLDYRIRVLSTLEIEDIEKRSKPEHLNIIKALLNRDENEIERVTMMHLDGALIAALRRIYD